MTAAGYCTYAHALIVRRLENFGHGPECHAMVPLPLCDNTNYLETGLQLIFWARHAILAQRASV